MELLKKINKAKNGNVVFSGSIAERMQGINVEFNDVDFVVSDLDGLEIFGIVEKFTTKSIFSESGNRAFVKRLKSYDLDIFIEPEFPEYKEIDGIKFETLDSMIKWAERKIKQTDNPVLKEILVLKIKRIRNE